MIVSEDNKEYTLKVSGNPAQMQAEDFILYIQSNVNVNDYGENGADGDDGIQNGSINIEISSIKVDGQPVNYTRSDSALAVGNTQTDLRLNIYNQHQRPQATLDIDPNFIVSSEIEVTFKTTGLFPIEEPRTETPVTEELSTEVSVASTDDNSADVATEVTPPATTAPPETTEAIVTTTAVHEETLPFVASANMETNAYTIGDRNYIFIFLLAVVSCLTVIISKIFQFRKHK